MYFSMRARATKAIVMQQVENRQGRRNKMS